MIKTIQQLVTDTDDLQQFDVKVNEFEKNNAVFATQTHTKPCSEGNFLMIAVCFYREPKQ